MRRGKREESLSMLNNSKWPQIIVIRKKEKVKMNESMRISERKKCKQEKQREREGGREAVVCVTIAGDHITLEVYLGM